MYCSFFGLQEKPFNVTPDPRFLFLSQSHQEALGHLLYGIEERKGFIEITGEVGTGKTVLCRALLERLGPHVRTALILNSFLSEVELLRSINEDFGIRADGTSKKALIDELNHFLIQGFSEGRNAVLIIDESQNLEPPVLEQIRMLSNLETERGKLLQIVLVGQPELRQQLDRPDLRQLNQRIAVRYHLQPLDQPETENYINHRLLVAGSHGSVKFSARALSRIYRDCDGIPRKVNLLCDRVLLTAYAQGTKVIDHRIVRQASAELEGGTRLGVPTSRLGGRRRWRVIGELTAVALLALLGGAFWLGYLPAKHLAVPAMVPVTTPVAPAKISETIQPDGGRESDASRSAKPSFAAPLAVAARVAPDDVAATRLEPQNAEVSKSARSAPADVDVLEQRLESSKPSGRLQPGAKEFMGDVRLRALLWEYARLGQQGGDGAKPTLAGVAANYSLEVLPIWTDLHRLKQFRVACVLETVSSDSSEPTLLIPRTLSADGVEVMDALGTVRRYSDAEFMQVWFGRAYLFHRSGTALKGILSRGKRDSEVQTLQQQLGELGYLAMAPTGVFDGETAEAVRRLQRDHYLQVDGAVGPATKILLYHLSGRPLDIL